jgi:hypothetical protein
VGRFPQVLKDLRFDDFLGLAGRDFSSHRVVAFVGESGSGKSTAIRFLREHHPDFVRRQACIFDEARAADLPRLWQAVARGRKLLVASHLPAGVLRALLPFRGVAVFETDRDCGKIRRYLERSGVPASAAAVEAYVRRFGATYTDVDLILERFPGRTFDAALACFERFCALERGHCAR